VVICIFSPPTQPRLFEALEREGFKSEEQRKVACAPSPPIHSRTHTQRAKEEHTTGEHTGTYASRHTLPRPRGRRATQAQFVRMEGKCIIYSSQHPPPPKGCGRYYLWGTPIRLMPVCYGTLAKQFKNLVGSIN
jgi:hypothetical protein